MKPHNKFDIPKCRLKNAIKNNNNDLQVLRIGLTIYFKEY